MSGGGDCVVVVVGVAEGGWDTPQWSNLFRQDPFRLAACLFHE